MSRGEFVRRGLALGVGAALSVLLVACGSDADEPAGLQGETPASDDAEQPEASASSAPGGGVEPSDGSDDGGTDQEPSSPETFAQPYLQAENVVELRAEVPIEVPDGAAEEERAAVRGYSRYSAAWEQVLWGVPVEQTGIEDVAAGERLQSVRDYAQESIERERVSVGPPVAIHLLSVEVSGSRASIDACTDTRNWIDSSADQPPSPNDPLYRFAVTLESDDGQWVVTRAVTTDDLAPCEGVFE